MNSRVPDPQTKSIAETRSALAHVIHDAAVSGQITYITNRGKPTAAIVPLGVADQAANAHQDTATEDQPSDGTAETNPFAGIADAFSSSSRTSFGQQGTTKS